MEIYEDTVYGQILPAEKTKNNMSGVMILVEGSEEYIVESNDMGVELAKYVDSWVTVGGIIKETSRYIRIEVYAYTLEDSWAYQDDDVW
ncbi:MAG: hypothetical protein ACNI27_06825 [Desulfovibrio sp.]